jgi:hypothetical protein
MAHFAEINNNKVVRVIVIGNDDITVNGKESEQAGKDFIANVLKLEGTWIQTSYNSNFRGKFAGISDLYDSKTDTFITDPAVIAEQQAQLEKDKAKLLLGGNQ